MDICTGNHFVLLEIRGYIYFSFNCASSVVAIKYLRSDLTFAALHKSSSDMLPLYRNHLFDPSLGSFLCGMGMLL